MSNLSRTKKIIYAVAIIIALAALVFLAVVYLLPSTTKSPGQEKQGIRGTLPQTGTGQENKNPARATTTTTSGSALEQASQLTQLTDFAVVSPAINKTSDRVIYYKKSGGDVFSSDFTGKIQEKISNLTILGLLEAVWSPSKDRAIVSYLDGETIKYFLHIGTSSVTALPQDIQNVSWAQDGKLFAYLASKNDSLNLVIADSLGKNARTVFTTPLLDAQIQWVAPDKIAFQTAASGLAEGFVFVYSRASGAFNKVVGPRFGLTSLWSPDGSKILTSSTDARGKNAVLSVRKGSGEQIFRVTSTTLPEKCVWNTNDEFYCAVPAALPQKSVLPDDYLRGELNTADRIIRFDLKNEKTEEVLNQELFDATNLLLSKNKDYLIFVNRVDGTLWSFRLK